LQGDTYYHSGDLLKVDKEGFVVSRLLLFVLCPSVSLQDLGVSFGPCLCSLPMIVDAQDFRAVVQLVQSRPPVPEPLVVRVYGAYTARCVSVSSPLIRCLYIQRVASFPAVDAYLPAPSWLCSVLNFCCCSHSKSSPERAQPFYQVLPPPHLPFGARIASC
jgi:hypothetical protein